jgi:hypothetical protein
MGAAGADTRLRYGDPHFMTAATSLAVLLSLLVVWWMYQEQAVCVRCNGRGRHRRDCPMAKHDD